MDRQIIWILNEKWGILKEILIELNVKIKRTKKFKGKIKDFCILEIVDKWIQVPLSKKEVDSLNEKINELERKGSFKKLPEYKMVNLKIPFGKLKIFRNKILELRKKEVNEKALSVCFDHALNKWLEESQPKRLDRLSDEFENK
ncbi:MAG: hypothetical protein EAX96_06615 [Candidatus Lokiarchaeota archaeon]|nr:hypothetical protein [Candidatus Lokiarchaeota archaeon]